MPHSRTVAAGVLAKAGSVDEQMPQEAGLAHALEHLLLQGTDRFPDKKTLAEFIEEVGGAKNARTSKESTLFFNQVPFGEFKRSVIMLSQQIQYSLLLPQHIASEMQVILQEINRTYDMPPKLLMEKVWEYIFQNHPFGHMVLGDKDSVAGFTREMLVSFMKRYYRPQNYVVIIVGNIDPERAEQLCNQYFNSTDGGPVEKNKRVTDYPKDKEFEFYRPVQQAQIGLAVPIDSATEKEKFCLDAFSLMVGSGSSSPLTDEVRTKRGLCYVISSDFYPGTQEGLFMVYAATSSDKRQEAIETVFSVLEKTKNDRERFEKTKRLKLGRLALSQEDPIDIVKDAADDIMFYGRPLEYDEIKLISESITLEDIQKTVDKYLGRNQFYTISLLPEKS